MDPEDHSGGETVTPEELYERIRRGERVTILDLRDRDEFEEWAIGGESVDTVHLPAAKFVQARATGSVADLSSDFDDPVVVCARGEASADAADALRDADVDAANLEGGMEGWARVYVANRIDDADADGATVVQYRRPSSGCLAYLVVAGEEAAVLDPLRAFAGRYVDDARDLGATLRYAIDTHVHADHVSGVRAVAERTGAEVVLPARARDRGLAFDARTVSDGDELPLGDAALTALHAPGHTTEMTAFRLGEVLFAGDLLFLRSVARPDLEAGEDPEAAARRLHRTLRERVLTLPGDTVVAPGHAPTDAIGAGAHAARLGELRERVAPLAMDEEQFVEYVCGNLPPRPANHERIVEANLGRRDVADAQAFELELGPNSCAVSAD